jgi:hypothetical protein
MKTFRRGFSANPGLLSAQYNACRIGKLAVVFSPAFAAAPAT